MHWSWLFLLLAVLWPAFGTDGLTTLDLLRAIKIERSYDYLVLLKNANASVSSNFTQREPDKGGLVADVMEQLQTPIIVYDERVAKPLIKMHNKHLLMAVHLAEANLEQHNALLKALAFNLNYMTHTRILFLLDFSQVDEMLLLQLFQFCWKQKMPNALALFADHRLTDEFHGYMPFPSFKLEQRSLAENQLIYPERLRNLQGYHLPIIVGGAAPRIIAYYSKQGSVVYAGTVGHFMEAFQQKHNCIFVQPLPAKPNAFAPAIELVAAVLNGTVEISMGLTFPSGTNITGLSYPYEQLNWCIMLPVEADVPASEYYVNVFELNAFLLTLAAMVLISVTLTTSLRHFGYDVRIYEFVLHDSCFRGTLGQPFVEVFRAPPLVRGIYLEICVLGLLLTAWFNSYFSAYVTSAPKEPPFNSFEDVIRSNLKVLAWKPEYQELIGRLVELRKYAPMFLVEPVYNRYISMRDSYDTRYGYMMPSTKWIIVNEQQKVFTRVLFHLRNDLCIFNNIPMGFPVHPNSIYLESIEMLILEVAAHGLLTHWLSMAFSELIEAGQLDLVDLSPHREFRSMQFEDLQYIWYGFTFMVLLAVLMLLLEVSWHRLRVRRRRGKRVEAN